MNLSVVDSHTKISRQMEHSQSLLLKNILRKFMILLFQNRRVNIKQIVEDTGLSFQVYNMTTVKLDMKNLSPRCVQYLLFLWTNLGVSRYDENTDVEENFLQAMVNDDAVNQSLVGAEEYFF